MERFLIGLDNVLFYLASTISIIIEFIGLAIIVYTIVVGIVKYVKSDKLSFTKMCSDSTLNHGLSIALEVLLASEIVKTMTVATITNLIVVVMLVLIRLFMAFMLHWEAKHKEEEKPKSKKGKK